MFKTHGFFRQQSVNGNSAPVASNVTFSGTLSIGETLTGDYDYSDPEGNPESGTTYQWYRADDASGTNAAAISGATALTYEVQTADMDKYLRFGVTPSDGTLTGSEAVSDWQQAWITNPLWANTILLVPFDGAEGATAANDVSDAGHSLSFGANSTLTTTGPKFGSACLNKSSNSGQVLATPLTDFNYGTGDFTIEWWNLYSGAFPGGPAKAPFEQRVPYVGLGISDANMVFYSGAAGTAKITTAHGMSLDTWHHMAICVNAGTARIFVDGVQKGGDYTWTDNITAPNARVAIGSGANGGVVGKIDEVRVLKGVGIYTENFTPPTGPFPREYMAP